MRQLYPYVWLISTASCHTYPGKKGHSPETTFERPPPCNRRASPLTFKSSSSPTILPNLQSRSPLAAIESSPTGFETDKEEEKEKTNTHTVNNNHSSSSPPPTGSSGKKHTDQSSLDPWASRYRISNTTSTTPASHQVVQHRTR